MRDAGRSRLKCGNIRGIKMPHFRHALSMVVYLKSLNDDYAQLHYGKSPAFPQNGSNVARSETRSVRCERYFRAKVCKTIS